MTLLVDAKNWNGVFTALMTPLLKTPQGALSLDVPSLEKLLERQIQGGVKGFVLGGSTGEGSLIEKSVALELFKESRRIVGRDIPLIAGLGILGTRETLKWAEELRAGVRPDAFLASPPAYVKAPQRGLEKHFEALAEATQSPICLYEIAGRSAVSIQVSTLSRLLDSKVAQYFVALKDASGDLKRASEEAQTLRGRMALLSGDDGSFSNFVKAGGVGVISVASHFFPKAFCSILELSMTKKESEALALQNKLKTFIDRLFIESNPIPVKSLAAELGWIQEATFEAPLVPMAKDLLQLLVSDYQNLDQQGIS